MAVVAMEGRAGAYGPAIGREVAKTLGLDFVDRLLLAEVARRVGASIQAVAESERQPSGLVDRLARMVQRMLERSAVAGSGGDPYFGPGIETLLARPYRELEEPPAAAATGLGEKEFINTTREVIEDIAESGDVVILSRGAAAILRDNPQVLRIGLIAHKDDRVHRIMVRERLNADEAAKFIENSDRAQARYFNRAFGSSPIDPFLYHVVINTSDIGVPRAADLICGLNKDLAAGTLR